MLLGAGSHQADRRVGVDHRLQYSGEAVVEIHDGLKVVEHQGCWRLHGQLGEKFEDVGHDRIDLPADETGTEGELWPAVVAELYIGPQLRAMQELRHDLARAMPPAAGDGEGRGRQRAS